MLDSLVARTIHAARLLELVCYDRGKWEISLGNAISPAERITSDDSVLLRAAFAPQCWVSSPDLIAELLHNGHPIAARPVAVPDEEIEFAISWRFTVALPEVASIR